MNLSFPQSNFIDIDYVNRLIIFCCKLTNFKIESVLSFFNIKSPNWFEHIQVIITAYFEIAVKITK